MILVVLACASPPPAETDAIPDGVVASRREGPHEVRIVRTRGPGTALLLDGVPLLEDGWNPDRPALAPDGTVAFVSGRTGIASIWTVRRGEAPAQVTNVGLEGAKRRPGQPPPGFVPPPVDDSLAFDGDVLRWSGPDGPHLARWR